MPKQTATTMSPESMDWGLHEQPKSGGNITNVLIMAIIVLIVMIVLIVWITQSRFMDHYSIPGAFFIAGVALACCRGAQMMKQETDWRFMAGLILLLIIGGYMTSLHNVNHAWMGALVLIFAFAADAGYSAYMKWRVKKRSASAADVPQMNDMLVYGGIACDVALISLLIYGITGDM